VPLIVIFLLAIPAGLSAQASDPAWKALDRGYAALRAREYDQAVRHFEAARTLVPDRVAIYKDLGYTLLKVGETEQARDRFGDAMRLDPSDRHVALEYAFLCYETKQQAAARRVFDRLRLQGNRAAEQAFQNIDAELAAGIARWSRAVELSPSNFSAHQELARLAEQRDNHELAARHFQQAWQLRPDITELLLDLGRNWQLLGRIEQSNAALLAASRGNQARAAEAARELLPSRYPYVYEFEAALALHPKNVGLRRELAYLHLEMGQKREAETEFARIVEAEPDDLLSVAQLGFLLYGRDDRSAAMPLLQRVLDSGDDELADRVREALQLPRALRKRPAGGSKPSADPKELAAKSLDAGYLKDALKYLRIAHEHDPADFQVMLKLGWIHNIMKDDRSAISWFRLASKSPEAATAEEAKRAYGNLRPALARFRKSAWVFPIYSSRWNNTFSYAQVKAEYKLPGSSLRVYASTRLSGDARPAAQLSDNVAIVAGGIATPVFRGATLWAEAGQAIPYANRKNAKSQPDYRGGLSFARAFGRTLYANESGFGFETNADLLYISRFEKDTLLYVQNRTGYTFAPAHLQLYWNANLVADTRKLHWANTVEQGPGVRLRFALLPKSMYFMFDAMKGRYTVTQGNPYGSGFSDFRAGVWYAFSR
jgi:Tfp pilus assembly protein PilF